jgi:transcriptional regulator with XRE-family HTH domain
MSILSENMRYLRAQQKYAQQKIADDLLITRGRYAKYEDGATEPPIEILIRISKYYRVSIDLLVGLDVRKYSLEKMMQLPDNRMILPITVDEKE